MPFEAWLFDGSFDFFFSMCAATRTANGYSCAICKAAYRTQGIYIKACPTCFLPCRLDFLSDPRHLFADLRPVSHLESIVSIHRNLSSTVSAMLAQPGIQIDTPGTFFSYSIF
jgi:BRCA1-associated RING domain protein 1